ncbi:hypothetical protein HMPREF2738_00500 [Clostridiales bacterium KLE1615]|nr:hypothetical protein HMPREF2738_00500 [Clostridiales bacterium KLE1615]
MIVLAQIAFDLLDPPKHEDAAVSVRNQRIRMFAGFREREVRRNP